MKMIIMQMKNIYIIEIIQDRNCTGQEVVKTDKWR